MNHFMTAVPLCLVVVASTSPLLGAEPGAAHAQAPAADATAMKSRIEALEGQVAELKTMLAQSRTDDAAWLNSKRAEAVKQIVRDVLADADTRASLSPGGVAAGWNNGFFIASADDNFLLRVRGLLMVRHTYSHQDSPPADDGNPATFEVPDPDRHGFDLARTRFGFFGHVVDPSWQYTLWTGYRADGGALLLDTFIRKVLPDGLSISAGQFKLPFWREWLVSEVRLPMAERSLLNTFSGTYGQGAMLGFEGERVHAYGAFTDGLNTTNTSWAREDTDYAFTVRGEGLIAGSWTQYADVEGWPKEPLMVVAGLAGHYQMGESGSVPDEAQIARWTADVSAKLDRFSLLAAVVGNHTRQLTENDQFGLLLEAGCFVTEAIESHVRWEWGDSDRAGDEDLSILTVGLDHHWKKHQARLIVDVGYAFNSVSSVWANEGAGWRTDSPGKNGQVVTRSQIQLSF